MVEAADATNQPIFSQYKSPTDWPWSLTLLVAESRRILSYMKNLPKDSQPPKSIWHSTKKCGEFIDQAMKAMEKGNRGGTMWEFEDRELEPNGNR